MAQRVNIVLEDDIDQSDAAETVLFGLDGINYEIDLSESNAANLREALALYVAHGRRNGGRRVSGKGGRTTRSRSAAGGPSAAEIREWGRANGWEVSERGRVSEELRVAYEAAN